jgi:uncharacterized protein
VASPCLASRVPHGTPVDPLVLGRIDRAEAAVRALGYRELRVRHLGELGRLELPAGDLGRAAGERAAILAAICSAGYADAEIDAEPFRSGRLTAAFLGRALPLLG